MKPEIIHIAESFTGGVFRFLKILAHELPDFTHVIFHGRRPFTPEVPEKQFPPDTELVPWNGVRREICFADITAFQELHGFLKKRVRETPDTVIHLHSAKAGFLGRLSAALLGTGRSVLYTPHAAPFLRTDIPPGERRIFLGLEKLAARLAGTVVCCSASEAAAFRSHNIPAEFICNGLPSARPVAHTPADNVFRVVTTGRISAQKGPDRFRNLAALFSDQNDIQFTWIGDGPDRETLDMANIHVTGWLSEQEVSTRLGASDLYLSTARWEGMSLSVIAAMSSGLALLLSDCTGNRDMVRSGWNGFLFRTEKEAAKRIREIRATRELVKSLGQNALTHFRKNFTSAIMARNYYQKYRNILKIKDAE